MRTSWSDRKRRIVFFIAVNLGMFGGFILAAFWVPRETRLSTFGWTCTALFVLTNTLLGMKLRKPLAPDRKFNNKRAWLIAGLSVLLIIMEFLWR